MVSAGGKDFKAAKKDASFLLLVSNDFVSGDRFLHLLTILVKSKKREASISAKDLK